jgi:hypothetical protein
LTSSEVRFLRDALSADVKVGNIRLREGEYQYDLAKAIASFQLEIYFPDVKDIIKRLYGEEKTNDVQFVRKVQTILKKMEKSSIVRILPKKTPWELQKYVLSSFKFQDSDKNLIVLGTDQEIKQAENLLQSLVNQQKIPRTMSGNFVARILILSFLIGGSYVVILWTLLQLVINPLILIPAFFIAVLCSILLGKALSSE